MTQSILAITVEGLGKGSADRLYRWASGPAPSWDSDGVYRSALRMWPAAIATSFDPREGRSSSSSMDFGLVATAEVRAAFYQIVPLTIGTLTSATSASSTSINLSRTDLEGATVVLEREAIHLTTHNGGGNYTCARGVLDTIATSHGVLPTQDDALFDAAKFPVKAQRIVTLVRAPSSATSYADEEVLGRWTLTSISAPQPTALRLNCDSVLAALRNARVCRALWSGRIGEPPQSTGPNAVWTAEGPGRPVAGSSLSLSLDGKTVVSGLSYSAAGTGSTRVAWTRSDHAVHSAPYPADVTGRARECFICDGLVGDESQLPYSGNVFTLALQLLTSSSSGDNFASGGTSYDLGNADLGAGLPHTLIDVAQIESERERVGALGTQTRLALGVDGKPVKVLDLINAMWRPYGLMLGEGRGGLLRAIGIRDVAPLDAVTITQGGSLAAGTTPTQGQRIADAIDRVQFSIDNVLGDGPVLDESNGVRQRARNPLVRGSIVALDLKGFDLARRDEAAALATRFQARWYEPTNQVDVEVRAGAVPGLGLGDVVRVTHDWVFDATGGNLGVTDRDMLITAFRYDVEAERIRLRLLDVGARYERVARIAPAAEVASWSSPTFSINANTYTGGDGVYATDIGGFAAGDFVALLDENLAERDAPLEVESVGATTITLTAASAAALGVTPAAGDVVTLALYDDNTSAAVAKWVFIADANETLGAAGAPAYNWTF